ncbi:hypothetical protein L198_07632 [Cryptococcus wingfieldii CBS 7118]|uniref:Uncharacterized protein n=1 Tax=Cryptococcus wingfieldii CBS 7118 TaxID=1295528 RepID=A0A1E3I6C9_9TREE|nr:hypothetical protein L198_07632 [Cryptococcus wingfieldii CBS 7118]ODN83935.1 hypothetical protein L198_07632 [Cryptococcus wingfieldii CBS 7118]
MGTSSPTAQLFPPSDRAAGHTTPGLVERNNQNAKSQSKLRGKGGRSRRMDDWYARGFTSWVQDPEDQTTLMCMSCSQTSNAPCLTKKTKAAQHERSLAHGVANSRWQEEEGQKVLMDVREEKQRLKREVHNHSREALKLDEGWERDYEVELDILEGIIHRHPTDHTTKYHCAPCSTINHSSGISSDMDSISDLVAHLKTTEHLVVRPLYLQQQAYVGAGLYAPKGPKKKKRKAAERLGDILIKTEAGPSTSAPPTDPKSTISSSSTSAKRSAKSRPPAVRPVHHANQPSFTIPTSATYPFQILLPQSLKAIRPPSPGVHVPSIDVLPTIPSRLSHIETIKQLGDNLDKAWEVVLADS